MGKSFFHRSAYADSGVGYGLKVRLRSVKNFGVRLPNLKPHKNPFVLSRPKAVSKEANTAKHKRCNPATAPL
jgi:hypothetical protein